MVTRPTPPDVKRSDLGPWVDTPSSSRLARYRYDYDNRAIHVQWANGKGVGTVYDGVDYEGLRMFARAASKGQKVNTMLNNYPYHPMSQQEASAPSNTQRAGLWSRTGAEGPND